MAHSLDTKSSNKTGEYIIWLDILEILFKHKQQGFLKQ